METLGIYLEGSNKLAVIVDVVISENHIAENTITELPLEDGSLISDHVIVSPDQIEISAEISNFGQQIDENGSTIDSQRGAKARTAWGAIKKLRNNRSLLKIVTEHEIYRNMVVESIGGGHNSPYTGKLNLTAKFKKIDIGVTQDTEQLESQAAGGDDAEYKGLGHNISKTFSTIRNAGLKVSETVNTKLDLINRCSRAVLRTIHNIESKSPIEVVLNDITFGDLLERFSNNIEVLPFSNSGNEETTVLFANSPDRTYIFNSYYEYNSSSWAISIKDTDGVRLVDGIKLAPFESIGNFNATVRSDLGTLIPVLLTGSVGPNSLGNDINSEDDTIGNLIVISFPPGVYEEIANDIARQQEAELNFDSIRLGYTYAP